MITNRAQLNLKPGQYDVVQEMVGEIWLPVMSKQSGFVQAVMLTPLNDDSSDVIEVVSYWESEEHWGAWAVLPVHHEIRARFEEIVESIKGNVSTVSQTWNFDN